MKDCDEADRIFLAYDRAVIAGLHRIARALLDTYDDHVETCPTCSKSYRWPSDRRVLNGLERQRTQRLGTPTGSQPQVAQ